MKPRTIIVGEGDFKVVTVSDRVPYAVYSAAPLFSCFGMLFKYQTPDGDRKAILYHTPSGVISEEKLNTFTQIIRDDKCSLSNVDITIAISDTKNSANKILNLCMSELRGAKLDKPPTILEHKACYCVDTLGVEGEVIVPKPKPKEEAKEEESFFSMIKRRFF